MAALSIGPLCNYKQKPFVVVRSRRWICCQNRDAKTKKEGSMLQKIVVGVEKVRKGVEENMSPKKKGDWKDITLMSLSFAVYVYMSQKIVCAYCAWMSMPRQPW